MKKILIVTSAKYPHGDALANYLENIIKLILDIDPVFEVIVIARQNPHSSNDEIIKNYEIIYVDTLNGRPNYLNPRKLEKKISEIANIFGDNDIIILFGLDILCSMILFKHFYKLRSHMVEIYAERFDRTYFDGDIKGLLNYFRFEFKFNYIKPIAKNAIAVSNTLKEYCLNKKLNTVLIPPLIDCKTLNNEIFYKGTIDKYKFIYSGSDIRKDRIDNILYGFSKLPHETLVKVELHFCGIAKETLYKLVSADSYAKLENCLRIHKWLDRSEYLALLSEMDFCIILRENNRTSKANFPSKIPEYLKYGIIPIVSRVGDYTEHYLQDGYNSLIINGCNPNDCMTAIVNAMELQIYEICEMRKNAIYTALHTFDYRNWKSPMRLFLDTINKQII